MCRAHWHCFLPTRCIRLVAVFLIYMLTTSQSRCVCGHGIHAHADYLSLVVHHCPTKYCVAYVQKVSPSALVLRQPLIQDVQSRHLRHRNARVGLSLLIMPPSLTAIVHCLLPSPMLESLSWAMAIASDPLTVPTRPPLTTRTSYCSLPPPRPIPMPFHTSNLVTLRRKLKYLSPTTPRDMRQMVMPQVGLSITIRLTPTTRRLKAKRGQVLTPSYSKHLSISSPFRSSKLPLITMLCHLSSYSITNLLP
ncbi:hypothetical protein EV421DRAFT_329569 [Armillaria borealis]|uniref:Secreted protein n=1 Tax=Armillaria borealis TaxID=47425 RepID=A0AA39JPP2_9AGAR|nr:hypothetical protein EV421DRAFT_329569 [Armillaria borealis]